MHLCPSKAKRNQYYAEKQQEKSAKRDCVECFCNRWRRCATVDPQSLKNFIQEAESCNNARVQRLCCSDRADPPRSNEVESDPSPGVNPMSLG